MNLSATAITGLARKPAPRAARASPATAAATAEPAKVENPTGFFVEKFQGTVPD